jgi:hypothetical protein
MPRRSFHVALVFCIATLFAAISGFAQDHKALMGKWNMISETDGDPVNWTLVLKDDGGKLTGTLTSPDGEALAKDFSYDGGVIKFKAPYNDQDYDIELKLVGDKLDGTWSGDGNSGKTSGTKGS